MNQLIREIEQKYLKQDVPEFRPGDTVRVHVRIREQSTEGDRDRVQAFEGVVIRRSGSGLGETMTVRRVTYGIGVERTFPVHAPVIDRIEIVRRGTTRRAKLYYLRGRSGRQSRIREDLSRTIEATTVEEMEAAAEQIEAAEAATAAAEEAEPEQAVEAATEEPEAEEEAEEETQQAQEEAEEETEEDVAEEEEPAGDE